MFALSGKTRLVTSPGTERRRRRQQLHGAVPARSIYRATPVAAVATIDMARFVVIPR